jgi:hypothetical protein
MLPATENLSVQELLSERRLHTELIKQHLLKPQNRIKMQVDKKGLIGSFRLGIRSYSNYSHTLKHQWLVDHFQSLHTSSLGHIKLWRGL